MDRRAITTLIVDDEPIARRVLREQLELFPEVAVVGEAADGREALRQISKLEPDLVSWTCKCRSWVGLKWSAAWKGAGSR